MHMKKIRIPDITVNGALTTIASFIAAVIIVSTIYIFAAGKAAPGKKTSAPAQTVSQSGNSSAAESYAAFTGLGRIRTATAPSGEKKDGAGIPVVVSPWFSYKAGDVEFYEELSRKSGILKNIIKEYFSQQTAETLHKKGEERIKSELCAELNAQLTLNKIQALYFSEYIFLD